MASSWIRVEDLTCEDVALLRRVHNALEGPMPVETVLQMFGGENPDRLRRLMEARGGKMQHTSGRLFILRKAEHKYQRHPRFEENLEEFRGGGAALPEEEDWVIGTKSPSWADVAVENTPSAANESVGSSSSSSSSSVHLDPAPSQVQPLARRRRGKRGGVRHRRGKARDADKVLAQSVPFVPLSAGRGRMAHVSAHFVRTSISPDQAFSALDDAIRKRAADGKPPMTLGSLEEINSAFVNARCCISKSLQAMMAFVFAAEDGTLVSPSSQQ